MKKRRKVNLLVILSVFICLVFVTLNSVKFKFLLEVIKLSDTLPTISTDFYNDPIDDITYEDITYKKRNGLSLKLDLYENNKDELKEYTKVLYAQARLIEGLPIENPTEISNLVCNLISK